ncbi:MAG: pyruvate dehydrogenase E1 component, partial [Janthinobacterium sp.]
MSAQLDQLTAQASSDPDMQETGEWLAALESVLEKEGPERAHYLMERLVDLARRRGAQIPFSSNTAYVNTIPLHQEQHCPGNLEYEERLRSWMRWNAMAMVVKANRVDGDLGGHLSSF